MFQKKFFTQNLFRSFLPFFFFFFFFLSFLGHYEFLLMFYIFFSLLLLLAFLDVNTHLSVKQCATQCNQAFQFFEAQPNPNLGGRRTTWEGGGESLLLGSYRVLCGNRCDRFSLCFGWQFVYFCLRTTCQIRIWCHFGAQRGRLNQLLEKWTIAENWHISCWKKKT